MRKWHVVIPIRPKAVQSVRVARGGTFFVNSKVKEWKRAIEPFIRVAAADQPPSKLPIAITACRYVFKLPKHVKRSVREVVEAGGFLPYYRGDLTDNLNKGLIDVCKGILFEDDSAIVRMSGLEKRYGLEDMIELELEEIPGLLDIDGKQIG